jgi:hypothetical protein
MAEQLHKPGETPAQPADPQSTVSDPMVDFAALLRLVLAAGLLLVLASGVTVAVILLPGAVHSITARVWIGIGLFGIVLAGLSGIGLYALTAVRNAGARSSSPDEPVASAQRRR